MTEDQIVEAIAAIAGGGRGRVRLGIGDDAAVWQPSRSNRSVITSDAAVEGVHFSLDWLSMHDVGWRAMTANASDLAAMGARPLLATVALGFPEALDARRVLECYRGLADCASACGIAIVGGDLTRAPVLTISIAAVGEVRQSNLKTRSGMRAGDVVAVTGELGASRAGLELLRGTIALDEPLAMQARAAYATPEARVSEGRWLGASANVHAMMDCSDGLSTDLARMARASGCGVRVESIPAAAAALAAAEANGEDAWRFALAGGEEFELIVAIAPRAFGPLEKRFRSRFGHPLLRVGVAQADERLVVVNQGAEQPLVPTGWDHFAKR